MVNDKKKEIKSFYFDSTNNQAIIEESEHTLPINYFEEFKNG